MRLPLRRFVALVAIGFPVCLTAGPVIGQVTSISVTEAMSSSGVGGTADWWEITNYGTSSLDMAGWKMDDSSFSFAAAVPLVFPGGVSTINPGETMVFVESAAPGTDIPNFWNFWTGTQSSAVRAGSYTGSGVGLSSAGDGIVLFSGSGVEVTPRVTFGAATTGVSFYYAYDASGNPRTSPNSSAILSTVGTIDGQVTFASLSTPQNTASPGTAVNAVPEPSHLALAALGGLAALFRRRSGLRGRVPSNVFHR